MIKLLSIAGSDPSGGAGIQMDLKVFSSLGAYGMAIPTSLTVQNTRGVYEVVALEAGLILEQLKAVLDDVAPHGIKIGMLGRTEIARELASALKEFSGPIVFDPVIRATTGGKLTEGDLQNLLPLMRISAAITPNRWELDAITGKRGVREAVDFLREHGVTGCVVVTGGDTEGKEAEDLVICPGLETTLSSPKIEVSQGTHGTGCAFSSALLFYLCQLKDPFEACRRAKEFITCAIKYAVPVGEGVIPVRPEANTEANARKFVVLERLKKAYERLRGIKNIHRLIPEVQSNLAEAIEEAKGTEDVAGFPGRIVRFKREVIAPGCPEFGASSHVARIVLTAMRFNPEYRACMNIKYKAEWIKKLQDAGFSVSHFSRQEEPQHIKEREGSTLDWGTEVAIKRAGRVPDIIYDEGDVGKEPMIRVLGKDSLDVVEKIEKISQILQEEG